MRKGSRVLAYLLAMVMLVTSIFGTGLPMIVHAAETTSVTYKQVDVESRQSLDTNGGKRYVLVGFKADSAGDIVIALNSANTDLTGTEVTIADDGTLSGDLTESCYWYIEEINGSSTFMLYTETDAGRVYLTSRNDGTNMLYETTTSNDGRSGAFSLSYNEDGTLKRLGVYSLTSSRYVRATGDGKFKLDAKSGTAKQNFFAVYEVVEETVTEEPAQGTLIGKYLFENNLDNSVDSDSNTKATAYGEMISSGEETHFTSDSEFAASSSGNGNAAVFNGTKGLLLDAQLTSDSYTISFDVKMSVLEEGKSLIYMQNSAGEFVNIIPFYKSTSALEVYSKGSSSGNVQFSAMVEKGQGTATALAEDAWTNVTLRVENGTGTLYIDGVQTATGTVQAIVDEATKIYVGISDAELNSSEYALRAAVDNILVYDGAVTFEQVYTDLGRTLGDNPIESTGMIGEYHFNDSLLNEVTGNYAAVVERNGDTMPYELVSSDLSAAYRAGVGGNALDLSSNTYGVKLDVAPDSDTFAASFDLKMDSNTMWSSCTHRAARNIVGWLCCRAIHGIRQSLGRPLCMTTAMMHGYRNSTTR